MGLFRLKIAHEFFGEEKKSLKHMRQKGSKSMNRKNKILAAALILGAAIFLTSMLFASCLNVFAKIAISLLLFAISIIAFALTVITYDRSSSEDIWYGVRLEIFGFCWLLIVWAVAIHFV